MTKKGYLSDDSLLEIADGLRGWYAFPKPDAFYQHIRFTNYTAQYPVDAPASRIRGSIVGKTIDVQWKEYKDEYSVMGRHERYSGAFSLEEIKEYVVEFVEGHTKQYGFKRVFKEFSHAPPGQLTRLFGTPYQLLAAPDDLLLSVKGIGEKSLEEFNQRGDDGILVPPYAWKLTCSECREEFYAPQVHRRAVSGHNISDIDPSVMLQGITCPINQDHYLGIDEAALTPTPWPKPHHS